MYKVKGSERARKVEAKRNRWPSDNRRSIRIIQQVIIKRGKEAAAKRAAR